MWATLLLNRWTLRAAILLAVIGGCWYAVHAFRGWQERKQQEAVVQREAEITASSLAQQVEQLKIDLAAERTRLSELNSAMVAERTRAEERVAIFNRHRLGDLLQAKPEMIEKRINGATTEVWKQIEQESRL